MYYLRYSHAKLTHFPIPPKQFFNYFHFNQPNKSIADKPSRGDDTLLTVGFNLRIGDAACHVSTKSRGDDIEKVRRLNPADCFGLRPRNDGV